MQSRFCKVAIGLVSILNIFSPQIANATEGDPVAIVPGDDMVPENLILMGPQDSHPKYIFIADKQNRTLTVWIHGQDRPRLFGAYPMDIGKLEGDKLIEGDHRTPEGIYFFQSKLEGSEINYSEYGIRAFTLDYPNIFDTKAGKTGSGIWLHAVPDTTSLKRGSRGCVVVRNKIIDKLSPLIQLKSTPMLILDRVNYVKADQLTEWKKNLEEWLEAWRNSWETKNLEDYMQHYASDFQTQGMNKGKWATYKKALNNRYDFISIEIKDPFLVVKNNQAIISFIQDYKSDALQDIGEKTLYVNKTASGRFEILTELWRPLSPDILAQKNQR